MYSSKNKASPSKQKTALPAQYQLPELHVRQRDVIEGFGHLTAKYERLKVDDTNATRIIVGVTGFGLI